MRSCSFRHRLCAGRDCTARRRPARAGGDQKPRRENERACRNEIAWIQSAASRTLQTSLMAAWDRRVGRMPMAICRGWKSSNHLHCVLGAVENMGCASSVHGRPSGTPAGPGAIEADLSSRLKQLEGRGRPGPGPGRRTGACHPLPRVILTGGGNESRFRRVEMQEPWDR